MNPYALNNDAINDFMRYHGIERLKDVADILSISAAYLTQIMKGDRALTEPLRLRLQFITRKKQDQLFLPNFEVEDFKNFSHFRSGVFPILPADEDHNKQFEFGGFGNPAHSAAQKKSRRAWWTTCA